MKHSSAQRTWLCFAFCLAGSGLLGGCDSDDGYFPSATAADAGSVDAPVAIAGDPHASAPTADAPMQGIDADGKDTLTKADAAATDARTESDARGDAALGAPECDIYDPQSCPAANMKCDLARHPVTQERYLACRPSGPKNVGEVCTGGSQCGRGLVCINTSGMATCRQVCDAMGGVPACLVTGQTCAGRSATYGVTFCL